MRLLPPKEEILFGPKNSNPSYFKNGIQHTPTQSFLLIKPSNKHSNGLSCWPHGLTKKNSGFVNNQCPRIHLNR